MLEPGTVTIKGKKYQYKFNHKARRLFMENNGLEYFADYVEVLKSIEPHPQKGVSIKGMEVMADLIIHAIKACQPFDALDADSFLDYLLENQNQMQKMMNDFQGAQEQDKKKNTRTGGKSKAAR